MITDEEKIISYLPFKINCEILDYKTDYVGQKYAPLSGFYMLGNTKHFNFSTGRSNAGKTIKNFKPILRDLNEFGNSIEKIHEFIGFGNWCEAYDDYFNIWFEDMNNIHKLVLQAPYKIFRYFLANHYDVYNMISNGDAINIKTIEDEY